MPPTLQFDDLIDYTAWLRQGWQRWLQAEGPSALAVSTGPHGDGRLPSIGALVRHIFSAELRYAERIGRLPLTDTATVACDRVEPLFELGQLSRSRFRQLIETLPAAEWDVPVELPLLAAKVSLSPRKIALHVLTHEIRHWAQVATLLRLEGRPVGPQDLLFSPVSGDPIRI